MRSGDENATSSPVLLGEGRGCCFSQDLAPDFPFIAWEMSLCSRLMSLHGRIPTHQALELSEKECPQGYPEVPEMWEALMVAVASTLPAACTLTASASGSMAFQRVPVSSLLSGEKEYGCCSSSAPLLLFLGQETACFQPAFRAAGNLKYRLMAACGCQLGLTSLCVGHKVYCRNSPNRKGMKQEGPATWRAGLKS